MEIATSLFTLVIFAVIVEFAVNVLKGIVPASVAKYITPLIQAALVGILVALAFGINIFTMLGYVSSVPAVGAVVTGLIISAGSVPVHELTAKLRASRKDIQS